MTQGDIKANFGRSEQELYKKVVVPVYGCFLKKSCCMLTSLLLDCLTKSCCCQLWRNAMLRLLSLDVPSLLNLISGEEGEPELDCIDWDLSAGPTASTLHNISSTTPTVVPSPPPDLPPASAGP
jgi:hypothetical protein